MATNLYNTNTGAKLKTGESYINSEGKKITQGTQINADGLTTDPALKIPETPVDPIIGSGNAIINSAISSIPTAQAAVEAAHANDKTALDTIAADNKALLTKTADTAAANETFGVNKESANLDTYNQQLNDINANIKGLVNESKAIPLQIQEEFKNQGATDRGVAPIQTGRLRENAIKALTASSLADVLTANINNSTIRYNAAKDKAKQAVDLKYEPIETEIAQLKDQLALNKDYITDPAEKKLLDAQNAVLNERTRLITQNKAIENDIQAIALEAIRGGKASTEVLAKISASKTVEEAMKAAGDALATSHNVFQKLDNGNTILVDSITGKVIKNYGGAAPTGDPSNPTPVIIPTVKTVNGNEPISGYTMKPGDDPFAIAQKNGTDMATLERLNPNIKDWHNIQVGATINLPNKSTGTGSILAATGLSSLEMNYMTQGTSALTRLSEKARLATIKAADQWAIAHGTDTATIQAQYKAYNETLNSNIKRFNNTTIAEGELLGTIQNLSDTADSKDFGKLKIANVAKLFAGEQLNDPTTLKYAVHLNQLRAELAYYNAAVSGNNQADDKDFKNAEITIKNGLNSGSLVGFKNAITSSVEKMRVVLKGSVDRSSKSIWDLFSVGDKFPQAAAEPAAPADPFLSQFAPDSIQSSISNSDFFNQFK